MGKLFISASCVLVAWGYFTTREDINLKGVPVTTLVVIGISSWLIARVFLSIYIIVIDTGALPPLGKGFRQHSHHCDRRWCASLL